MVKASTQEPTLPASDTAGVKSSEERTEKEPAGNATDDAAPDGAVDAGDESQPAEAAEVETPAAEVETPADVIDVDPLPETPLTDAGLPGGMRYTQAAAEINDLIEGINNDLRTPGAPPTVRLKVYRRLPEYAACWLPALHIQLGAPLDLEEIGEEYGGGIYDLQLQKKGKNVANAKWKGIPFGGPPRMLPGEGSPPPSAPLVYQGTGAHRGVQVVQPAAGPDPGIGQLADGIKQLAEGFAATQTALIESVAKLGADIEEARRNPPDPLEGIARSLESLKTLKTTFEAFWPEPAQAPAPLVAGSENAVANAIAVVDAVTQRLPGLVQGAQALLGSQSVQEPVGQLRPVRTVQPAAQAAPATPEPQATAQAAPPPPPPAPKKRPKTKGRSGSTPKAKKPQRKSRSGAKGRS